MNNVDFYAKAINGRIQELKESKWLTSFLKQLNTVLNAGNKPLAVQRIRCLALGSFTDMLNPRFQLALLLIIAEHIGCTEISAWDPVFNEEDMLMLDYYKIKVTDEDFDQPALWYVPHGPFSLVVDLPLKIGDQVYIGNDLSIFDLHNREKQNQVELYKRASQILSVAPNRQDRWFAAFSSTAVHRKVLDT